MKGNNMSHYDYEDYNFGELVEFPETKPVARKQYKCHNCGDQIEKGERHVKVVGKYDGLCLLIECISTGHVE